MAEVWGTDLMKGYGSVVAYPGADLDIRDREFMVFVGPSGSGKSTLLRCFAGLGPIARVSRCCLRCPTSAPWSPASREPRLSCAVRPLSLPLVLIRQPRGTVKKFPVGRTTLPDTAGRYRLMFLIFNHIHINWH